MALDTELIISVDRATESPPGNGILPGIERDWMWFLTWGLVGVAGVMLVRTIARKDKRGAAGGS